MQIIIPMSGFGERFRSDGYKVPKPLININNKPIIQHVVEMFNDDCEFIFICNEKHTSNKDFEMLKILRNLCSRSSIVSIPPHKLGPVHAVQEAKKYIDLDRETIVNYCDFSCYWNFQNFKNFVFDNNLDGAIPSYKNFHPHSIHGNYYAFLKTKNLKVLDIQEKKPFTKNPINEFASSGTYYFRSGNMMLKYFNKMTELEMKVNNEYYVSMTYKLMIEDKLKVYAFNLEHFMQWGTPRDLQEYKYWSDIFEGLIEEKKQPIHKGALIVPMAGLGTRYKEQGYKQIKPMIEVSGKPMYEQALNDLPIVNSTRIIIRNDKELIKNLKDTNGKIKNCSVKVLNDETDGQASTVYIGSQDINLDDPVTIGACDNGMLYDDKNFLELMNHHETDVIVWGARGYPGAIKNPNMYGWIDYNKDNNLVKKISVKKPLDNPREDLIIVGTFTFKKLKYFIDSVESMKKRKALINNEYYIDTAINDSISLNLNCRVFEINNYICWGTPDDLRVFEYWQSCFHKWKSHKYSIHNDPNINKSIANKLEARIYGK